MDLIDVTTSVKLLRGMALALGMAACCLCVAAASRAEDRSLDGTGNNVATPNRGAANTPVVRIAYQPFYANGAGAMLSDAQRPNARTISNAISAQTGSLPSARGLSDYVWAWGQFLDHDMSLSTSSNGAVANGYVPIAINDPGDPLGPNPIPFVRSNWVPKLPTSPREQVNEVTSFIDASHVYGSNATRAAALRTGGGLGAKLTLDAAGLLPLNTMGLPNDNDGPFTDESMFVAGDVRANENVLLTSLHTVFAREHNRLVDRIAVQQPELGAEQQYQLARKIVGAEMQIITYREFLPALMGPTAPTAEDYAYFGTWDASITNSFAHAAYRFGHSTLSLNLQLAAEDASTGSLQLRNAFFNPSVLAGDPTKVDALLQGAARQVSQEVDVHLIDDVRNFLFGPPGAGGLDLAALNIQRGRDHGLPNYNLLRTSYEAASPFTQFNQITSDASLAAALQAVYGNINNIDPWVGALAEDHLPGASVGRLISVILGNQFQRTRDGDRLFFLSDALGLYAGGVLRPEIASIIDLESLRLSDLIEANSLASGLQSNVFFAAGPGDFDSNGVVDAADLDQWREDIDNGVSDGDDLLVWQRYLGTGSPQVLGSQAPVPEPASGVLLLVAAAAGRVVGCRRLRRHA